MPFIAFTTTPCRRPSFNDFNRVAFPQSRLRVATFQAGHDSDDTFFTTFQRLITPADPLAKILSPLDSF